MGLAVLAQLPTGSAFSTLEVKVHFVRPIAVKTGTLVAEGKVVHPGPRIATAEARLVDRQGKLYCPWHRHLHRSSRDIVKKRTRQGLSAETQLARVVLVGGRCLAAEHG